MRVYITTTETTITINTAQFFCATGIYVWPAPVTLEIVGDRLFQNGIEVGAYNPNKDKIDFTIMTSNGRQDVKFELVNGLMLYKEDLENTA
jgi:hypothetical protein